MMRSIEERELREREALTKPGADVDWESVPTVGVRKHLTELAGADRNRAKVRALAKAGQEIRGRYSMSGYDIVLQEVALDGDLLSLIATASNGGMVVPVGNPIQVYNPPILIPDGTTRKVFVLPVGQMDLDNFQEGLVEALHQVVADTVRIAEKHAKRAAPEDDPTFIAYPDAHPETNTCDGQTLRTNAAGETWATLVAGAGTSANDTNTADSIHYMETDAASPNWETNLRSFFGFPIALSGWAVINTATISLYVQSKDNTFAVNPDPSIGVYLATPASPTALVAADYAQVGSTLQQESGDARGFLELTAGQYEDWVLNATGIGNTPLSGVFQVCFRNNYDVSATPPAWESAVRNYVNTYFADDVGSTRDPKITLGYSYRLFGGVVC